MACMLEPWGKSVCSHLVALMTTQGESMLSERQACDCIACKLPCRPDMSALYDYAALVQHLSWCHDASNCKTFSVALSCNSAFDSVAIFAISHPNNLLSAVCWATYVDKEYSVAWGNCTQGCKGCWYGPPHAMAHRALQPMAPPCGTPQHHCEPTLGPPHAWGR